VSIGKVLTSLGAVNFGGMLNINGTAGAFTELIAYPNFTYSSSNATFTSIDLNGLPLSGYTLAYNANQLDLLVPSGAATWISSGGGSWTAGSNWSSGSSPNAQGAVAILGSAALSPATITLDGSQTVGTLTFNNSNGYSLVPGSGGSLTFDNTSGTGDAQIIVLSGTHSIAASLTLAGTNTAISSVSGGSLDISGSILDGSGGSSALTFSSSDGTGVLSLDGTNTFAGGLNVASGTVVLNGAGSLLAGSSLTIGSDPGYVFAARPQVVSSVLATPATSLTPAPEPGTLALLVAGAAAMAFGLWRRKK
jgi:autotransporter-associated beta strand protein